jgi:hypothetical protein
MQATDASSPLRAAGSVTVTSYTVSLAIVRHTRAPTLPTPHSSAAAASSSMLAPQKIAPAGAASSAAAPGCVRP